MVYFIHGLFIEDIIIFLINFSLKGCTCRYMLLILFFQLYENDDNNTLLFSIMHQVKGFLAQFTV